jgi:hypothetical protein
VRARDIRGHEKRGEEEAYVPWALEKERPQAMGCKNSDNMNVHPRQASGQGFAQTVRASGFSTKGGTTTGCMAGER